MADEESEIRRMAEIADAINAILDANPVGDTPSQRVAPPQADTATDNAVTPNDGDDDLPVDLDAAIAAELGNDAGDDFGPVPGPARNHHPHHYQVQRQWRHQDQQVNHHRRHLALRHYPLRYQLAAARRAETVYHRPDWRLESH